MPGETWLPLRIRQRSPAAQPRAARPTGAGAAQRSHAPPQGAPCAAASPAARRKGRSAGTSARAAGRMSRRTAHRRACRGCSPRTARAPLAPTPSPVRRCRKLKPLRGSRAAPAPTRGHYTKCGLLSSPDGAGLDKSNTLLCNVAMRPSQPPRACGPPCPPAGAARPPAPVASRQQQRAESEKMRGRCPRRPRARR